MNAVDRWRSCRADVIVDGMSTIAGLRGSVKGGAIGVRVGRHGVCSSLVPQGTTLTGGSWQST